MTKNYTLATTDVADEQKTITISEEVTTTKEVKTTVSRIKELITRKKEQIKKLREEINEKIDEIQAVNDNTDITVEEIPVKIVLETKGDEKIVIK